MYRTLIPSVVVAVVIGLAFGSVVFPQTRTLTTTQAKTLVSTQMSTLTTTSMTTLTTTQVSTLTLTANASGTKSYTTVTFTRITILVVPVVGTCTTVSGTATVTYIEASGGQSTTVTTIYPPNQSGSFYVTVVTASAVSGSEQTHPFTGSC